MALYIPHSIFHLARLLYVRPETFGPYYVYCKMIHSPYNIKLQWDYFMQYKNVLVILIFFLFAQSEELQLRLKR